MTRMHLCLSRPLPRRTFLRAGAVSIALPFLQAMLPRGLRADEKAVAAAPRRLLLAARFLGTNEEFFFPRNPGLQYEATRYLRLLEAHRGRFTVVSGMSHLGYPNAHHTESGLLTGAAPERIQRVDYIFNTVSLDQAAAAHLGKGTRYPYVNMGRISYLPVTWSPDGVAVPLEERPEEVFRRLFLDGTPEEASREMRRLADGLSILDGVRGQLKRIAGGLGTSDREQLDLLTTSIRQAEQDLERSRAWAGRAKPKVDRRLEDFSNPGWSSGQKMRYDLAFLAFQSDVTRVSVCVEAPGNPGDAPGTVLGHHEASHHGRDPRRIEQLALFEEEETRNLAQLLDKLAQAREAGMPLLDRTVVLWASNLGNPSAHATNNLPILVAGGGFRHQGHLAFDREHNKPLSNLYVRVLQQLGLETDRFGSSTGVLSELG
jgi:hypothetical protein